MKAQETKLKLVTSNPKKGLEFARLNLPMEIDAKAADLPEVQGTSEEVAIYKAKLAGKGRVVEDTIMIVNGKEMVDIRWNIGNLPKGEAIWKTTLAHNDGNQIHLYVGEVHGTIVEPEETPSDAFAFDPYFVPQGSQNQSLYQLEQKNKKDNFSARAKAVGALKSKKPTKSIKLSDIPEWTGSYQLDHN